MHEVAEVRASDETQTRVLCGGLWAVGCLQWAGSSGHWPVGGGLLPAAAGLGLPLFSFFSRCQCQSVEVKKSCSLPSWA